MNRGGGKLSPRFFCARRAAQDRFSYRSVTDRKDRPEGLSTGSVRLSPSMPSLSTKKTICFDIVHRVIHLMHRFFNIQGFFGANSERSPANTSRLILIPSATVSGEGPPVIFRARTQCSIPIDSYKSVAKIGERA